MLKPQTGKPKSWIEIDFDKEFYGQKLNSDFFFSTNDVCGVNIAKLAKRLNLNGQQVAEKLRSLGFSNLNQGVGELKASSFVESKYAFRPDEKLFPQKVDCSSFVQGVYKSFGITLPRFSVQQVELGEKINLENLDLRDLKAGDLLFFCDDKVREKWKSESGIEMSHVVLCLGGGRFIDSSRRAKPSVTEYALDSGESLETVFKRRLVAVRRYVKDFGDLEVFKVPGGMENLTESELLRNLEN